MLKIARLQLYNIPTMVCYNCRKNDKELNSINILPENGIKYTFLLCDNCLNTLIQTATIRKEIRNYEKSNT